MSRRNFIDISSKLARPLLDVISVTTLWKNSSLDFLTLAYWKCELRSYVFSFVIWDLDASLKIIVYIFENIDVFKVLLKPHSYMGHTTRVSDVNNTYIFMYKNARYKSQFGTDFHEIHIVGAGLLMGFIFYHCRCASVLGWNQDCVISVVYTCTCTTYRRRHEKTSYVSNYAFITLLHELVSRGQMHQLEKLCV